MKKPAESTAWCPRCHRDNVRTEKRGNQEVYVMHGHIPGGVSCHNSGRPVQR